MAKRAARPGYAADAITGEGDLVGDVAAGRQSLQSLPETQLPDDLRLARADHAFEAGLHAQFRVADGSGDCGAHGRPVIACRLRAACRSAG